MNKQLLNHIVCPSCKGTSLASKEITKEDSILICKSCKTWYICEENILELLKDELNEVRKATFFKKHEKKLKALKIEKPKEVSEENAEVVQKKSQMSFFNKFSSEYVLETQSFWKAYYSMFFDKIKLKIPKGSLILDVGCGTGLGSIPFLNKEYTVIGIDLSREMVKKALARIPEEVKEKHYFFVADAENLPFKKETFDRGLGLGILHHVHDVKRTANAITSCLKKEGWYFGHENNKTILRPLFDALMKIYTLWHEEAGEEQLLDAKDLKEAFKECEVKASTHVFLPPHILNWFKVERAKKVLVAVDKIAAKIPGVRNNGGSIIFEAQKRVN